MERDIRNYLFARGFDITENRVVILYKFIQIYLERQEEEKLYDKSIMNEVAEFFGISLNLVIQSLYQCRETAKKLWGKDIILLPKDFAIYLAEEFYDTVLRKERK